MTLVRTFSLVSFMVSCLVFIASAPALAISNASFESGALDGWSAFGDASVTGAFGSAPTDGSFQLLMSTLPNPTPAIAPLGGQGPYSGTDALLTAALETGLGIDAGVISALSQNGNPAFHGSAVMQTVTLNAGAQLSFDWNFLTNEPPPTATYTDFFFWALVPASGSTPIFSERLADTNTSVFSASPAADFANETGYSTRTFDVLAPGDYRIIFGVVDVQDGNYTSALLLDNVAVPEPGAGPLGALGLAGLVVFRRGRRKVAA